MTPTASPPKSRYISLRWRILVPVFAMLAVGAFIATYGVVRNLSAGGDDLRANVFANNVQGVVDRLRAFANEQRALAVGFINTPVGLAALANNERPRLESELASYAQAAGLEGLLLYRGDFEVVGGMVSPDLFTIQMVLETPSLPEQTYALIGIAPQRVLDAAQGGTIVDLRIQNTQPQGATAVLAVAGTRPLFLAQEAVVASGTPLSTLTLEQVEYFVTRLTALEGFDVTLYLPADQPLATEAGQSLIALTLAAIVTAIVIAVLLIMTCILSRVNRIRTVVEKLAVGDLTPGTGMRGTDEVGALGATVDRYAARVQEKQEEMRSSLRRQRRELEHFTAMIESIPDGVIVQDIDGHVTFINEQARVLVGEKYNYFKRTSDQDLTAAVAYLLSGVIPPGGLGGSPQRVEIDGRVLSVQSAAMQSVAERQIGAIIILRDVTAEARREQARTAIMEQIAAELEVRDPVSSAHPTTNGGSDGTSAFVQEAKRREIALGRLLVQMRELTTVDSQIIRRAGRSLSLEMLIYAVVNEWRAIANAANLTLDVVVEQQGLMLFGDERRLRWAIGSLIDNAVKYTPPGGKISLEIKGAEAGYARLRVRDNGVGIAAPDLVHVFERFYRGTPVAPNGRAIQVPGTGLGLSTARDILHAHGGAITVRSAPGVGTAVYLTLPLEGALTNEAIAQQVANANSLGDLIDDDEDETVRLGVSSLGVRLE